MRAVLVTAALLALAAGAPRPEATDAASSDGTYGDAAAASGAQTRAATASGNAAAARDVDAPPMTASAAPEAAPGEAGLEARPLQSIAASLASR
jgi:hypothetical protein